MRPLHHFASSAKAFTTIRHQTLQSKTLADHPKPISGLEPVKSMGPKRRIRKSGGFFDSGLAKSAVAARRRGKFRMRTLRKLWQLVRSSSNPFWALKKLRPEVEFGPQRGRTCGETVQQGGVWPNGYRQEAASSGAPVDRFVPPQHLGAGGELKGHLKSPAVCNRRGQQASRLSEGLRISLALPAH